MGIISFFSKQFIDVIQWTESEPGVLAYRYPMQDMEIQNGAQLVVRETQMAAFFNEGKFADQFTAGTYTLNTKTIPILTYLKNWDKAFESPFKSDVYFFSKREQLDQKWGTAQPITIRDKEFGPIRIRTFGNYSYAIENIELFWTKLCGTAEKYSTFEIEGQLRAAIITAIASFLGKSEIAFVDMAANQEEFSKRLKEVVEPTLKEYGLALKSFYLQSLSLPEELEKHLDRVGSMKMVGNLEKYTQFQTADAIATAAANDSGVAGAGAGLGAGIAMGQMMSQSFSSANKPSISGEDYMQTLENLAQLLQKGILTQAEFDAKKAEILEKIK